MAVSRTNRTFVNTLVQFSGGTLVHQDVLGTLLDLGTGTGAERLERVAFLAKFVTGTYGIMKRIGKDAEGYGKLAGEFGQAMEEIVELLSILVDPLPATERSEFTDRFLAMTPASMESLLSLLSDLTWYKNWLIDNRSRPQGPLS